MGPGGHVLTFPVRHGKTLNIVAFHTSDEDWPDHSRLTRPGTKEDALRDFEGYSDDVIRLIESCEPNMDVWGIFHLGDHPLPSFAIGTLCLVGDAAHATSPHHGAGAGFCVEDSAMLSELLADERVQTKRDIEAAFATYDALRRERDQWLVETSYHIGNCYEWLAEGVGEDFVRIAHEINTRNSIIADVDVAKMCRGAREYLSSQLSPPSASTPSTARL